MNIVGVGLEVGLPWMGDVGWVVGLLPSHLLSILPFEPDTIFCVVGAGFVGVTPKASGLHDAKAVSACRWVEMICVLFPNLGLKARALLPAVVPNIGVGDWLKGSPRDRGFEDVHATAAFKRAVKRLRRLWRLHFQIDLVHKDWSFCGSNFGFSCIEDTTGFSYGIGQLLDIRKTFCLFTNC
uniref:Uncharacterized protein n=1 Tax=Romanomermis culicivorax TaxID=13658 RepID=A0A915HPD8_ROMCU